MIPVSMRLGDRHTGFLAVGSPEAGRQEVWVEDDRGGVVWRGTISELVDALRQVRALRQLFEVVGVPPGGGR